MQTVASIARALVLGGCLLAPALGCGGNASGIPSLSTGTGSDSGSGAGAGAGAGAGGAGSAAATSSHSASSSVASATSTSASVGSTAAATTAVASSSASSSASGGGGIPNDGFDQFQHRNLDDINQYRATLGTPPLVLDQQLSTFAQAGAQELSMDHLPHQHFKDAISNNTIWSSGFVSQAGENQGDPNGWTVLSGDPVQNELMQIDAIQLAMFNEGPGAGEPHGHYTNMMNTMYTRVGVGLLEVNGQLYLTNDFSQ